MTADKHWLGGQAIEVDHIVPASGNLAVGRQQFLIGTVYAGRRVRLWMDATTVHLSLLDSTDGMDRMGGIGGGAHLKTVPSRQTTVTLARLRADPNRGARPAGPPPVRAVAARVTNPSAPVEIDRVVNANGLVGIAGPYVSVGQSLHYSRRRPERQAATWGSSPLQAHSRRGDPGRSLLAIGRGGGDRWQVQQRLRPGHPIGDGLDLP